MEENVGENLLTSQETHFCPYGLLISNSLAVLQHSHNQSADARAEKSC